MHTILPLLSLVNGSVRSCFALQVLLKMMGSGSSGNGRCGNGDVSMNS